MVLWRHGNRICALDILIGVGVETVREECRSCDSEGYD